MGERWCHEAGCARSTEGHLYDPETCPERDDACGSVDDDGRVCDRGYGHPGGHLDHPAGDEW